MPTVPLSLPDVIDRAHPFTVLSKPHCPQCNATKRKIAQCGATYAELDISVDGALLDAAKAAGFASAPVVLTRDGQAWSGYRPDRIAEATSRLGSPIAA